MGSRDDAIAEILKQHLSLGSDKAISYLPLGTVLNVLGLSREAHESLVLARGHACLIEEARSPISTFGVKGAVYAYSELALEHVLAQHQTSLRAAAWPTEPKAFVARLATEWVAGDHEVMAVIREAFGD